MSSCALAWQVRGRPSRLGEIVLIRCESCSTVYQLDENLLPPSGAPVQCNRCSHVFTAIPPEAPGRTLVAFAAASPPSDATEEPSPAAAEESSPFVNEEPSPPVAEPFFAPPELGPPPPPPSGLGVFAPLSEAREDAPARASALFSRDAPDADSAEAPATPELATPSLQQPHARSDTITRFAAELRRSHRRRWLVPLLGLILVGLTAGAYFLFFGGIDRRAVEKREEAQKLMARDDRASLEAAIALLGDALKIDGEYFQAEGDRCVALLLVAAGMREEIDALDALIQILVAQRVDGTSSDAELGRRLEEVKAELDPKLEKSARLKQEAQAAVAALQRRRGGAAEVSRALAVAYAFEGDGEQVERLVKAARAGKVQDVWIDFAEAAVEAYATDGQAKESAVQRLGAFAVAHPEILRGRLALARVQIDQGLRAAALATLDGLLAANPAHERAIALKANITAAQTP
jgi:predicted Zn finger-like uncharacterized protein